MASRRLRASRRPCHGVTAPPRLPSPTSWRHGAPAPPVAHVMASRRPLWKRVTARSESVAHFRSICCPLLLRLSPTFASFVAHFFGRPRRGRLCTRAARVGGAGRGRGGAVRSEPTWGGAGAQVRGAAATAAACSLSAHEAASLRSASGATAPSAARQRGPRAARLCGRLCQAPTQRSGYRFSRPAQSAGLHVHSGSAAARRAAKRT